MTSFASRAVLFCAIKRNIKRSTFCKFRNVHRTYGVRQFLDADYSCQKAWEQRLSTPILQKVDVADFAMKVQEKFDKEGQVSAIDIDILANKLEQLDPYQLDFIQNLFYRFRHTREAKNVLASTHHAVVDGLLKLGDEGRLLEILKQKIDYGIFLDYPKANMLLDHFIDKKQYKNAAQIACDMMLQEELAHPITRLLAWYACHLRWQEWLAEDRQSAEDHQSTEPAEDEEEETFIPVLYIREPWYDDHFDIPKEIQMVGKTLTMVTEGQDNIVGNSHRLVGWALYEKFDQGIQLLQELVESDKNELLTKEAMSSFMDCLTNCETKEPEEPPEKGMLRMHHLYPYVTPELKTEMLQRAEELVQKLETSGKIAECDMEAHLISELKTCIDKVQQRDMSEQEAAFKDWNEQRDTLLQEQIKRQQEILKRAELTKRLEELREKEETLSYFDQQEKVAFKISVAPEEWQIEDVKEQEQFVAAPSERGKGM